MNIRIMNVFNANSDFRTVGNRTAFSVVRLSIALIATFVFACGSSHAQQSNQGANFPEPASPQLIRTAPPMRVNPNPNVAQQSFGSSTVNPPSAPQSSLHNVPQSIPQSLSPQTDFAGNQSNNASGVQPAVAWGHSSEMSVSPASAASAINSVGTSSPKKPIELLAPSKGTPATSEKPQSSWGAIISMVFSLLIVLCVFLSVAWMVRKSQPSAFLKLPTDVVQVMGRTPMAPRQQMYVVRFGNKMLLVSHQPGQTQTLCEITDEDEVQRLAGLCEANQPSSITSSFREVFKQVASGKQPAAPKLKPQTRA